MSAEGLLGNGLAAMSATELSHYDEATQRALDQYPPLPADAPKAEQRVRTGQIQAYRDLLLQAWSDPEHARAIREDRQRLRHAGRSQDAGFENATDAEAPPLRWRTAKEIEASTSAAVPWIAAPWLAKGALTEVDAKIKLGKTTWILHMVRNILDGELFLGIPTVESKVVVLTEQNDTSFRAALGKADLLGREDLFVLSHHDVRGVPWPSIVEGAVAKAVEIGATVLIVDTFGPWAGLAGDSENDAGAGLAAIAPLQAAAAQNGLAVIIIRHERKGSGEVGESARGSTAIGGAVDVIVSLRRLGSLDKHPTRRRLLALSRFDETPAELLIDLTETGYVIVPPEEADDAKSEAKSAEQRTKVLDKLPSTHADAMTVKELAPMIGLAESTVRAVLNNPGIKGLVLRYKRSDGAREPFRYYRSPPEPTPWDKPVDLATSESTKSAKSTAHIGRPGMPSSDVGGGVVTPPTPVMIAVSPVGGNQRINEQRDSVGSPVDVPEVTADDSAVDGPADCRRDPDPAGDGHAGVDLVRAAAPDHSETCDGPCCPPDREVREL